MKRVTVRRTDEEKRKIIENIERLREQGVAHKDACAQSGIAFGQYYDWRGKFGKKDVKKLKPTGIKGKRAGKKPTEMGRRRSPEPAMHVIAPAQTAGKVFMIYGSPDEVAAVMRSL